MDFFTLDINKEKGFYSKGSEAQQRAARGLCQTSRPAPTRPHSSGRSQQRARGPRNGRSRSAELLHPALRRHQVPTVTDWRRNVRGRVRRAQAEQTLDNAILQPNGKYFRVSLSAPSEQIIHDFGSDPSAHPAPMEYISTRGGTGAVDFEGALFSGYAPDDGLFMPSCIPSLDRPTLQQWSHLSYPELVKEICFLFVKPELIPHRTLSDLIDRAFSKFRHKDIVHLSKLKNGLNVLELWHGVTYAFKDLSLSCTGQFLQYFLEKKQKHINVLVGTSGDTGSSAIESVRGQKNVDIFVLLPKGLCTQIQELQMTTVIEDNVHVFVVDGNSDEIDEPIRELLADVDFARRNNLMSVNSVNWSRIMVQIAHYFYAYFRCTPTLDSTTLPVVEIVVPTGGGGNVTAGCIAQKMGLPIQLVAAVNSNDIIHRTVKDGDFSLSGRVKATLASAMDIQEPYNVERILWLLSGSDSHLTKTLMEQFTVSKSLKLPKGLHRKVSETLRSCSASDEDIVQAMQRCWEENHYLLCPHSAVAAHYHYSHLDSCGSGTPRCCLAPASAAKFQDAVLRAGLVPEIPPEITALTAMETRSTVLQRGEDWARVLRDHITAVEQRWGKRGAALASPGLQGVSGQA